MARMLFLIAAVVAVATSAMAAETTYPKIAMQTIHMCGCESANCTLLEDLDVPTCPVDVK